MRNEDRLHDALSKAAQAYHLIMDGAPEEGAAYRFTGERHIFESGVAIFTTETFQIYVFQKQYSAELVQAIIAELASAGFAVTEAGQGMQDEFYKDELIASRAKED